MKRKESTGETKVVQGIIKHRRASPHGVLILLSIAMALAAVSRPTIVAPLEDALFRFARATLAHREPAPEVIIVGIDDRALKEIGGWPWSRAQFSGLLERLRSLGAGLIAIDGRTASDAGLPEARLPIRKDGGPDYTAGFQFYPTLAEVPSEPKDEADDRALKEAEDRLAFPSTPSDDAPLPAMAGIQLNRFSAADRLYLREGFSNLFPDADGVVRQQPLAVRLRHRIYPAMALVATCQWRGFTPILAQDAGGRPSGVLIGEERISTPDDAFLTIGYRGPAGTFSHYSAAEIIAGQVPAEEIDSRLLLVGITSPSLKASHPTPFGPMPDIEIAANVIDNLLLDRPVVRAWDKRYSSIILLVLGLVYAFAVSRLSPRWGGIATAGFVGTALISGVALLAFADIAIPAALLSLCAALLFAALFLWRLVKVESPKRAMRQLWLGRIGTSAIDAVAADAQLLSGPGRAVGLTALACDIKGFAALVEGLAPTQLAEFVKEYRRLVAAAVTEHEGFIESWSGDECRAIFGVPVKSSNHALSAVRAAALMRRSITARRDEFERRFGVERFRVGIGIHTGTAAAGDVGAGGAIGFGAVGGAIEAACQLRGLNRSYRTSTLLSEPTKVQTESAFAFRALDPLFLTGERTPCYIHELVGETGTILPQLAPFLTARDAYLHGDFARAARLFGELLKNHPHDGPSQLFLRRALFLAENPPEGRWHGIWKARSPSS